MKYYDFTSLILKYSSEFEVISSGEGYYNDLGDYVETEPQKKSLKGAIISLSEDKIFRSEGLLTKQDRQLYMLEPLPKGLIGSIIVFKDNKYRIQGAVDNSEFTGVYAYTLKYVSAFKETPIAGDITEDLDRLEDRLDGVLSDESETFEMLGKRLGGGTVG